MLNNIKSKNIFQKIFRNIKKVIKLKILKHNKNYLNKLNMDLKDYQEFKSIRKFNEKYKLSLKNSDETCLRLNWELIGDEGLDYLSQLEFLLVIKDHFAMNATFTFKSSK